MVQCSQCGARVAPSDGPTHPYYGAAPGCWALFGEVIAREFSDYRFARLHRLTADAYAAQHPGSAEDRRAVQSVAVHLIGLCLSLEPPAALTPERELATLLHTAADRSAEFRWLRPPAHLGEITIVAVHEAVPPDRDALRDEDAAAHLAAVRQWAESVWDAWAAHHDEVRRWAASLLQDGASCAHRRLRR